MTKFGAPIPRSFDEARTKDFYLDFLGFTLVSVEVGDGAA